MEQHLEEIISILFERLDHLEQQIADLRDEDPAAPAIPESEPPDVRPQDGFAERGEDTGPQAIPKQEPDIQPDVPEPQRDTIDPSPAPPAMESQAPPGFERQGKLFRPTRVLSDPAEIQASFAQLLPPIQDLEPLVPAEPLDRGFWEPETLEPQEQEGIREERRQGGHGPRATRQLVEAGRMKAAQEKARERASERRERLASRGIRGGTQRRADREEMEVFEPESVDHALPDLSFPADSDHQADPGRWEQVAEVLEGITRTQQSINDRLKEVRRTQEDILRDLAMQGHE